MNTINDLTLNKKNIKLYNALTKYLHVKFNDSNNLIISY